MHAFTHQLRARLPRTVRLAAAAVLLPAAALSLLPSPLVHAAPSASHTAAASSSSAAAAASSTATLSSAAGAVRLESAEDEECPWCTAMTAGGCASEFAAWRNCSRRVQAEAADNVAAGRPAGPSPATACMGLFKVLDSCVRLPGPDKRDYYRTILPLDSRDIEPSAEEKARDAQAD